MLHASASRLIAARVGAPVGSRAARGDAAAGLGAPVSPPGGINRAQRACAGVQGRPWSAAGSSGGGSGGGGGSAGSSPRVSALQTLLAPVCVELQAGAAQPAGPSSTCWTAAALRFALPRSLALYHVCLQVNQDAVSVAQACTWAAAGSRIRHRLKGDAQRAELANPTVAVSTALQAAAAHVCADRPLENPPDAQALGCGPPGPLLRLGGARPGAHG